MSDQEWTIPTNLPFAMLDSSNTVMRSDKASVPSGLETTLPADTKSHMIMPFFAGDSPQFAIVTTSQRDGFSESDISCVRSIGSIMLAKRTQDLTIEADKAKTAFLSSISHELRTPLHSLITAVGLAQIAADAREIDEVRSVLETVRSSGTTLQTILNDVLDFGKITSNLAPENILIAQVDAVKIVKHAISMSLSMFADLEPGFSLRLEYEEGDWVIDLDAAKYSR